MFRFPVFSCLSGLSLCALNRRGIFVLSRTVWRKTAWLLVAWMVWLLVTPASAVILWNDLAIATSFSDFIDVSSAGPSEATSGAAGGARAFNFQSWQKEQGLPQSPVRALAQTHDGYALEYFQMTGIQCELDIPAQLPPHPLSSQMRHHLSLATHEAITNILKHSSATRAKISMVSGKGVFEINVSDDGKGFNAFAIESKPELPTTASGDGLSNMRRRLADIGGHCRIESRPGQGTNIRFVISLNYSAKDV